MPHISEESLVDYLYDEGDPAERLKVARHLQDCAACSVTVLEMQSVRGLLSEWTPPPVQLGFKIVSADEDVPVAPRQDWWRVGAGWPAWAKAAAGVLVFAAGMAVSQLSVEYGSGALTVRARSAGPVATSSAVGDIMLPAMPVSERESPSNPPLDLAGLESRLKTMIDKSEGRQQRALALRLSELVQDFDTQRRADMLNVEQNFGQLEGQTGAEVAQQRELLNSLVKVSQQAK
jgi:putative zinc finger protein